ncbi:TIGR03619 family F420-dependent LLM class oxidoreductase [Novosphingobium album (ex Liu et al. 2023)]|uniref:TIGR03619 family F420-dependent LLM class oxidoreductase n=1 Tax=Novosphingobium album (ex Liu et al. 2023) TaxID=3031130 RepID=A0ABT5WTV2_9SPHN|nr:TIGR03619 family F420-dependent LLM class oxidoreductase [Novosphingobium album (ex Liu et al. 2023)]MDE8653288.1 TIGR03619 family F420-dependent LLM class oxidoreductase [Novosphingobium album (ex Liu et al. 2023)]
MKLGFAMPHMVRLKAMTQPWEAAVTGADQTRLAKWAEKLGYEMIAIPEHHIIPRSHVELSGPHYFHAYSAMGYIAGATETIRVNSCIAILPAQHPIVTAKALSTIDWLSSGRVTITFAVGWLEEEFDLLGIPFHQRGAMAEEYTQAIIALWTQENPEFEGKYVSFRDVAFEPKPVQQPHIPIWFGGDADAVLGRVARYADGWWPFLTKPETLPERIDFIRSRPDYNGRLRDIYYGMSTSRVGEGHAVIDDPKARPGQTRQEIIDRLGWLEDLGVTWSSVPIPAVRHIQEYYDYTQWVAEEIMPAVR